MLKSKEIRRCLLMASCVVVAACVEMAPNEASRSQAVTIPGGMECSVGGAAFSPDYCEKIQRRGANVSFATFRLKDSVLALLGDGTSPSFHWSNSSCPASPFVNCVLPVSYDQPVLLSGLLTSPDGTVVYDATAVAEYTLLYPQ